MNSKQLQELVRSGIIDDITAQKIDDYFKSPKSSTGRLNIILGILGALMASLGVILVIAHNWDDLGRSTKTFLAFLPLTIGQLLCVYTLLKKNDTSAWREISSLILFFAIASCISLVSQIYHVSGSMPDFLLVWLALGVPLGFIMRSSVTSLLSIAVAGWYACDIRYFDSGNGSIYYYLLIMGLLVLRHIQFSNKYPRSNFNSWHNWFFMLSAIICFATLIEPGLNIAGKWWFSSYLTLFSAFYLLGTSLSFEDKRWYNNPYFILSIAGSLIILMYCSYQDVWNKIDYIDGSFPIGSLFMWVTMALFLVSFVIQIKKATGESKEFNPLPLSFLIMFILSFIIPGRLAGSFVVNMWTLFIAIWYIRKGSLNNHLGILNFGLLIIATLAVMRFFDSDIAFVWRGIFFLMTGAGFFIANYSLLRKRKQLQEV